MPCKAHVAGTVGTGGRFEKKVKRKGGVRAERVAKNESWGVAHMPRECTVALDAERLAKHGTPGIIAVMG